jgi:hypothetical protein
MKSAQKAPILLVLAALFLPGAEPYRKPPQRDLDVLNIGVGGESYGASRHTT